MNEDLENFTESLFFVTLKVSEGEILYDRRVINECSKRNE